MDFTDGRALLLNNAEWLLPLNYLEFLREIGVHFSVNRMLTAECFRARMERGLSFIEFNYMLLQAYDYLHLYRKYGCRLQVGGDDQWSNMLAGADLIRRVEGGKAYVLTWPLLTTASGKMGRPSRFGLASDPIKTSPLLSTNTGATPTTQMWKAWPPNLLPMEGKAVGRLEGEESNEAKKVLAHEVTKPAHGPEAAPAARKGGGSPSAGEAGAEEMPPPRWSCPGPEDPPS